MPSLPSEKGTEDEHVAKRYKITDGSSALKSKGGYTARLFVPFRTIGLISPTNVPFTTLPLGKTTFQITVSVGRCLQTYDLRRGLNLVFLTRPHTPEHITATTAWKDRVFAAWGDTASRSHGVWIFKRGLKIDELEKVPGPQEKITQLLVFGSWIVGCCLNQIHVWKSGTYEHHTTLTPAGLHIVDGEGVLSGGICNLPTYLNKILVGRRDGSIEVWNVSAGKLVYTILPSSPKFGAVCALQPAPTLSVVAIAHQNGSILLRNVRSDRIILLLKSSSSGSGQISSISFRTDGVGAGEDGRLPGVMATCRPSSGDVHFWDLNEGGRLKGVLRGAHYPRSSVAGVIEGGISKIEFLVGQPVIVTGGLDNSLRTWIFDETPFSPIPRILHSRSGHAAPVNRVMFIPSDADGAEAGSKWLLTAAKDRSLWGWSLRRDGQSTELSQGSIRKKAKQVGLLSTSDTGSKSSGTLEDLKAPEITCMAISLNRDGGMGASQSAGTAWSNARVNFRKKAVADVPLNDSTGWESVVTGHKDDRFARTWFWGRKRAGRWTFEAGDKGNVTSVAITACGTFALVGSSKGSIDLFNLQSGLHRRSFPAKLKPSQARSRSQVANVGRDPQPKSDSTSIVGIGKHEGAVNGITVDSVNRNVISCGSDGKLKFWNFVTGTLIADLDWFPLTAITGMIYHPPNDLIAFGAEDLSIRVVDIETRKLIRHLRGCSGRINDFCFSNDGRWIIAASTDSVIRVWDLPTGHLIDAFRVSSPCTALACSHSGEFLATAHEDSVGVSIWTNRTLFTHVPARPITEFELAEVHNPTVSGEAGTSMIEAAYDDGEQEEEREGVSSVVERLGEDLTTLSLVPRSRWQTLIQLDLIKQRNKPTEPPKAPERAPFFLPSLGTSKASDVGLSRTDNDVANDDSISAVEQSRIMKMVRDKGIERPFTKLLHGGYYAENYEPFIAHLKTLSPSAADLEIRSLGTTSRHDSIMYAKVYGDQEADDDGNGDHDGDGGGAEMDERNLFVLALTYRLRQKMDYELIQAWMSVFLKIHASDLLIVSSFDDDDDDDGDHLHHPIPSRDEDRGGDGGRLGRGAGAGSGGRQRGGRGEAPSASLIDNLQSWKIEQEKEGKRLATLTGYCLGILGFLKSPNI